MGEFDATIQKLDKEATDMEESSRTLRLQVAGSAQPESYLMRLKVVTKVAEYAAEYRRAIQVLKEYDNS